MDNNSPERRSCYKANKLHLVNAIHALGLTYICVDFSGEGDSGQMDDIVVAAGWEVEPEPTADDYAARYGVKKTLKPDDIMVLQCYLSTKVYNTTMKGYETVPGGEREGSLTDLITMLWEFDNDAAGVDWHNNDGGHGHWLFDPDDGFQFEINQRETTSTTVHTGTAGTLHEYIQHEGAL